MNSLTRLLACLLLACMLVVAPAAAPAVAATEVESYVAEASVAADGTLSVRATIAPRGGEGEVSQRFATTLATTDASEYRFTLSDIRVTRDGADAGARVTTQSGYQEVTVPVVDDSPLLLEYTVTGAAFATDGGTTTVLWRLLQGLNLPVRSFDATVLAPAQFESIDCAAGPPGAPGACTWYAGGTHETQTPTFHDGPRGAGEVVQVELRFPESGIAANQQLVQLWSLDRAFSVAPFDLGVAALLGLLGLAALWALRRRFAAAEDPDVTPTIVGTFRPVGEGRSEFQVSEGIRPGEVGTLVDTRVDHVDVTATILDLAVHGSLLIRELPHSSTYARADWELERRDQGRALRPYEQTLLDAVAPAGQPRRVSELGPVVADVLPTLQGQLYDEVVERGWFTRRPDSTRNALTRLGWVLLALAVVVTGLLIAFTTFGIAGLVLVSLAAGFGFLVQDVPTRSASGSGVLAGLALLRGQLLTQPTEEMPPGREVEELSEVLPYAVVLGGTGRWLDGLAATDNAAVADETELPWFHGPDGWRLADLPDSLRNFVTTVEGTLVER